MGPAGPTSFSIISSSRAGSNPEIGSRPQVRSRSRRFPPALGPNLPQLREDVGFHLSERIEELLVVIRERASWP